MRVIEESPADAERVVVHPRDGPVVDDRILADPARLRAVADLGLLDTGDEDPFDRWALRATQLTGAGTALVSLVDSTRSFFKTFRLCDGSAGEGREVPISMSLCREVVVRGEPLVVADAMHDRRTKDYGAVRAFPVGAYAGIPLRSAEGHVVGSFCVVDAVAREWTADEIAALADLAAAVQAELRLRTARHEIRRHEALMDVQQRIHALMLDGAPRATVLAELVAEVEQQTDGLRASIELPDAGPSGTPPSAAGWDVPIVGTGGVSHGRFALHSDQPWAPLPQDLTLLGEAARLAAIVLERDAASRKLERQRRQLIEGQSVGRFGSWDWDIVAQRGEWSAQLYRLYGVEPREVPMPFEEFLERVHPDDREMVQATHVSGESFSVEHRIIHEDGSVRVLHARGEVVRGDDGMPVRMHGTEQDVTERREIEHAKDEFTAMVSHELRTPLTSIRGSLGLLESGVLGAMPVKGQRMLEIAVQNTERLMRLTNDILDLERMASGAIDMSPGLCDAAELIERAIEGIEQFAVAAEVRLVSDAQSVALVADRDRVLQTLTNLISNAVKFSQPASTVWLSAEHRGEEVLFTVRDQGRGIPEDRLEAVFERFEQVAASDSRDKGGTGLGLAICRKIVEGHGGRIWVHSRLGAGSTFSFALPAQKPA